MTKDEFIYSKLWPEKCWHEWEQKYPCGGSECVRCGKYWPLFPSIEIQRIIQRSTILDLTTWQGFGMLWERMSKEWDWNEFLLWLDCKEFPILKVQTEIGLMMPFIDCNYIHPERFRDLVFTWLGGKP